MRKHLHVITDEERIGHVRQLLAVLVCQLQGRGDGVGDDIVHVGGAAGAGVAQPHHLDGRGAESEDFVARALGVAVHVEQDVDAVGVDAVGGLAVTRDLQGEGGVSGGQREGGYSVRDAMQLKQRREAPLFSTVTTLQSGKAQLQMRGDQFTLHNR